MTVRGVLTVKIMVVTTLGCQADIANTILGHGYERSII